MGGWVVYLSFEPLLEFVGRGGSRSLGRGS
jgi:hypothetical protein